MSPVRRPAAPQPAVPAATRDEAEASLQRKLERAERLGHDIARIAVSPAASPTPPPPAPPAVPIAGTASKGALQRRDMRAVMIDQRAREKKIASKAEGAFTTVGFEWDVAETTPHSAEAPNVLEGLTHVELAESDLKWNKLPYLFETDAGNVLEFVTPPFYLKTRGPGSSLPDLNDLNDIIDSTRSALEGLVAGGDTLEALMAKSWAPFAIAEWEQFDLAGKVEWRNWSQRAQSKDDIEEGLGDWKAITIAQATTGKAPQINIAATSQDYAEAQGAGGSRLGDKDSFVKSFNDSAKKIENFVVGPSRKSLASTKDLPPPALGRLNRVLDQLTQVLAQQFVVTEIEKLAAIQKQGFDQGQDVSNAMRKISGAPSYIKDTGMVWLKTDLFSFCIGTLREADWPYLAGDRGVLAELIGKVGKAKLGKGVDTAPMTAALTILKGQADGLVGQKGSSPQEVSKNRNIYTWKLFQEITKAKPKFNEHSRKIVGVRQDTFITPTIMLKLGQQLGFKTLLSVIEVRNTEAFLEWLKTGVKSKSSDDSGSSLGVDGGEAEVAATIPDGNNGVLHANVTAGDGNCFFHSVYESRNNARSSVPLQLTLRQSVLDALALNEQIVRSHFGPGGIDSAEYQYFAAEMLEENAWVTDQTPSIASDALNMRIVIHNPDGTLYFDAVPNGAFAHVNPLTTVHVQYTGNHYNSYTVAPLG